MYIKDMLSIIRNKYRNNNFIHTTVNLFLGIILLVFGVVSMFSETLVIPIILCFLGILIIANLMYKEETQ